MVLKGLRTFHILFNHQRGPEIKVWVGGGRKVLYHVLSSLQERSRLLDWYDKFCFSKKIIKGRGE